jgi:hypothetical protein
VVKPSMSGYSRRKPPSIEPTPAGGRFADFLSARRSGLGAVAVVLASLVAAALLWSRISDVVIWRDDAILRPEMVELRGVAPWVKSDIKTEALRTASLDGGVPIGDPELPNRLARAFDTHPWVKQVVSVKPRHPAAAVVEVLCREPVAMVSVKGGLLAVDAEGVVLPSGDFTPEAAAEYPRVTGIESSPQGPEGSAWGDTAVEEAAAVAVVIGPEWKSLGLVDCRPKAISGARAWELVGPDGQVILFGSAPGQEREGEPSAAAKVARLKSLQGKPLPAEGIDLSGK